MFEDRQHWANSAGLLYFAGNCLALAFGLGSAAVSSDWSISGGDFGKGISAVLFMTSSLLLIRYGRNNFYFGLACVLNALALAFFFWPSIERASAAAYRAEAGSIEDMLNIFSSLLYIPAQLFLGVPSRWLQARFKHRGPLAPILGRPRRSLAAFSLASRFPGLLGALLERNTPLLIIILLWAAAYFCIARSRPTAPDFS